MGSMRSKASRSVPGSGSMTARASGCGPSIRDMCTYDFVGGRTHDGRKFRILSIIDEDNRGSLALPGAA